MNGDDEPVRHPRASGGATTTVARADVRPAGGDADDAGAQAPQHDRRALVLAAVVRHAYAVAGLHAQPLGVVVRDLDAGAPLEVQRRAVVDGRAGHELAVADDDGARRRLGGRGMRRRGRSRGCRPLAERGPLADGRPVEAREGGPARGHVGEGRRRVRRHLDAQPPGDARGERVPLEDPLRRRRGGSHALRAALEVREGAVLLEHGRGGDDRRRPSARVVLDRRHLEGEERAAERRPPALAVVPVSDRVGPEQDDRLDAALLGRGQRLVGRGRSEAGGLAAELVGGARRSKHASSRVRARRAPGPPRWRGASARPRSGSPPSRRRRPHSSPSLAAARRSSTCAVPGPAETWWEPRSVSRRVPPAPTVTTRAPACTAFRIRSSTTGARWVRSVSPATTMAPALARSAIDAA